MGMFDFLKSSRKTSDVAKNRLQFIIAQQRGSGTEPDYLPVMREELLAVIQKYVTIDADAVKVNVTKEGDFDVLDIKVDLPDGKAT